MSAETASYIRDLVIIGFGIAATTTALALLTVSFLLYRKISAIVNAVQATAESARTISQKLADRVDSLNPFSFFFGKKRPQEPITKEGTDDAHSWRSRPGPPL